MFTLPQRLFEANLHAEIEAGAVTALEVEAAGPFPAVPLTVVSGSAMPPKWLMSLQAAQAKRAHQQELVRCHPWASR